MTVPIQIISGGNWGSEAKGAIAGYFAKTRPIDIAVRTGAINAGHTVYVKGKPYAMQQIPVGFVNEKAELYIGPGAYIHPEILEKEINMLENDGFQIRNRLWIDHRAGLHNPAYQAESKEVNRHHLIGATGKGCAEAIIHKIRDRKKGYELFSESFYSIGYWNPSSPYRWANVPLVLAEAYHRGLAIQLEGTQGERLDFHLGSYPFVTSRQTTAAAWVAEAGLSPAFDYEVVLVCRTYPIRVAGNSGPMDGLEISWPMLARKINNRLMHLNGHPLVHEDCIRAFEDAVVAAAKEMGYESNDILLAYNWSQVKRDENAELLSEVHKVALDKMTNEHKAIIFKLFEATTVTKKLRRVAAPSWYNVNQVAKYTGASAMALTFLNYEFPELWGCTDREKVERIAGPWIRTVQDSVGIPVRWVTTERYHTNVIEVRV